MAIQQPQQQKQAPPHYLELLTQFLDNGLIEEATRKIKEWGLKIKIENGKLIDVSNTTEAWLRKFITQHPLMMQMKDKVRKLAKEPDEVLIIGATGTGKEIIARALHGDKDGEFVAVNCAGLPETLIESLLFGHLQGSFTGASETRPGFFQLAKNGTLFFDEIGELPLGVQAKFLRALQEKIVVKIGSSKEEQVNCRVVCATHRNLEKMVTDEKFREDLYARISVFELKLLSITDRACDVIPIFQSLDGGVEFLTAVGDRAMKFPQNVRSIQKYVRRYKVLGELP
jgi:two-component system, NtrC family, response regulator